MSNICDLYSPGDDRRTEVWEKIGSSAKVSVTVGMHCKSAVHYRPVVLEDLHVVQVNLDMMDSMGPGKLVRHMQNLSYTYDEYLICTELGPSILSVICKNPSYSGPSYPSSPVLQDPKVKAVGESRLDYSVRGVDQIQQRNMFWDILKLAVSVNKPVIIH